MIIVKWTDLECGCSFTEDSWWVVRFTCHVHPKRFGLTKIPGTSHGGRTHDYGPFKS